MFSIKVKKRLDEWFLCRITQILSISKKVTDLLSFIEPGMLWNQYYDLSNYL